MRIDRQTCLRLGTALALVMLSHGAWALGLGQARVLSYLDQPLEVRIGLISRSEAELATVTASMASPSDYRIMGLSPPVLSMPLEFTVNRELADPHILVRSAEGMNEPVLQLVVEVVWAGGRMLKQYTLFFDPPTVPSAAPMPSAGRARPAATPSVEQVTPPVAQTQALPAPMAESRPLPPPAAADLPQGLPDAIVTTEAPQAGAQPEPVARPKPEAGPPFDPVPDPPSQVAAKPPEPAVDPARPEALAVQPEQVAAASEPLLPEPEPVAESEPERQPEPGPEPAPPPELPPQPGPGLDEALAMQSAGQPEQAPTPPEPELPEPVQSEPTEPEAVEPEPAELVEPETPPTEPAQLLEPAAAEPAVEPTIEPAVELAAEPAVEPSAEPIIEPAVEPIVEPAVEPSAEPIVEQTAEPIVEQTAEPIVEQTAEPVVEQTAEPIVEPAPEPAPVDLVLRATAAPAGVATGHQVARGETLWGLSREWARARGVDVNQMMLAVQQHNPQAFQDNNINRMLAGAVLRLPPEEQLRRFSERQAMLEVMRQGELYRAGMGAPPTAAELPSIADAARQPLPGEAVMREAQTQADSRLELVPPATDSDGESEQFGQGNISANGGAIGESLVEELARTEEELANARQENAYLAERIEELEGELGRLRAEQDGLLADTSLAELEQRLRDDRLSGSGKEQDMTVTPPAAGPAWYQRFGGWLAAVLVLGVAGLVLLLRRRSSAAAGGPP